MSSFVQLLRGVIELFYSATGDYGIAIVLITVAMRLLMVPLNGKQRRQAEQQREISRKAEEIRSRYKKNQKKMEAELQKLYQENGTGMGACLLSILPFPVMVGLYQAIRLTAAATCATVLLPWVPSLIVRDPRFLLPAATLVVQVLPQLYPYLRFFKALELQKQPPAAVAALLLANSLFVFMIPSGVGLYYFTSGLFQAVEQLVCNVKAVKRLKMA